MYPQIGPLMVIESGTAQTPVIEAKAQRLDEMQLAARVRAQADDVAGIWRNFWLIKDNVKHESQCS